jgi:hypothetical protein
MNLVESIKTLIRPLIALAFVATTCILFFDGKLEAKDILQITSIVIGFYFGERATRKETV